MRSEHERRQLVREIVATSNPAQVAVELFGGASPYERANLLGVLFEVDPLPEAAIDGVFRAGLDLMDESAQEGDWIVRVAQSNDKVPWTRVLAFLESRTDPVRLIRHVRSAWWKMFDDMANNRIEPHSKTVGGAFLRAALAHTQGQVMEGLDLGLPIHLLTLFQLSVRTYDGAHWTDHPATNLGGLLEQAWNAPDQIKSLLTPSIHTKVSALDTWLSHPPRQQLFEQYARQDRERAEAAQQWKERWLVDGQMDHSPLERWQEYPSQAPFPFDDLGLGAPFDQQPRDIQDKLLGGLKRYGGQGRLSWKRQADLLDWVEGLVNSDPRAPRKSAHRLPVDPLAVGLYFKEDWAIERLKSPAHAEQVQHLLEDPRASYVLGNIPPAVMGDCLVKATHLQSWRNARGQSVLDLWIEGAVDMRVPARMARPSLIKIAKKMPELLTHVSGLDGKTALDRLEISEDVRAQARAELLKHEISPKKRVRATGRAM